MEPDNNQNDDRLCLVQEVLELAPPPSTRVGAKMFPAVTLNLLRTHPEIGQQFIREARSMVDLSTVRTGAVNYPSPKAVEDEEDEKDEKDEKEEMGKAEAPALSESRRRQWQSRNMRVLRYQAGFFQTDQHHRDAAASFPYKRRFPLLSERLQRSLLQDVLVERRPVATIVAELSDQSFSSSSSSTSWPPAQSIFDWLQRALRVTSDVEQTNLEAGLSRYAGAKSCELLRNELEAQTWLRRGGVEPLEEKENLLKLGAIGNGDDLARFWAPLPVQEYSPEESEALFSDFGYPDWPFLSSSSSQNPATFKFEELRDSQVSVCWSSWKELQPFAKSPAYPSFSPDDHLGRIGPCDWDEPETNENLQGDPILNDEGNQRSASAAEHVLDQRRKTAFSSSPAASPPAAPPPGAPLPPSCGWDRGRYAIGGRIFDLGAVSSQFTVAPEQLSSLHEGNNTSVQHCCRQNGVMDRLRLYIFFGSDPNSSSSSENENGMPSSGSLQLSLFSPSSLSFIGRGRVAMKNDFGDDDGYLEKLALLPVRIVPLHECDPLQAELKRLAENRWMGFHRDATSVFGLGSRDCCRFKRDPHDPCSSSSSSPSYFSSGSRSVYNRYRFAETEKENEAEKEDEKESSLEHVVTKSGATHVAYIDIDLAQLLAPLDLLIHSQHISFHCTLSVSETPRTWRNVRVRTCASLRVQVPPADILDILNQSCARIMHNLQVGVDAAVQQQQQQKGSKLTRNQEAHLRWARDMLRLPPEAMSAPLMRPISVGTHLIQVDLRSCGSDLGQLREVSDDRRFCFCPHHEYELPSSSSSSSEFLLGRLSSFSSTSFSPSSSFSASSNPTSPVLVDHLIELKMLNLHAKTMSELRFGSNLARRIRLIYRLDAAGDPASLALASLLRTPAGKLIPFHSIVEMADHIRRAKKSLADSQALMEKRAKHPPLSPCAPAAEELSNSFCRAITIDEGESSCRMYLAGPPPRPVAEFQTASRTIVDVSEDGERVRSIFCNPLDEWPVEVSLCAAPPPPLPTPSFSNQPLQKRDRGQAVQVFQGERLAFGGEGGGGGGGVWSVQTLEGCSFHFNPPLPCSSPPFLSLSAAPSFTSPVLLYRDLPSDVCMVFVDYLYFSNGAGNFLRRFQVASNKALPQDVKEKREKQQQQALSEPQISVSLPLFSPAETRFLRERLFSSTC
jgi:hypothetical protein